MKMNIGTMVALVLVAAAVSGLVINFGMVYAGGSPPEVKVEYELKLKQKGGNVEVEVKAQGVAPGTFFTVRAYLLATDCGGMPAVVIGLADTASSPQGNLKIEGTIADKNLDDVKSVSIRLTGSPGPLVQCFLDTAPNGSP